MGVMMLDKEKITSYINMTFLIIGLICSAIVIFIGNSKILAIIGLLTMICFIYLSYSHTHEIDKREYEIAYLNDTISFQNYDLNQAAEQIAQYKDELIKCKEYLDSSMDIDEIFTLYQAALAIRKYYIRKYVIDRKTKEVHIYCSMATYTKMSINKEIIPGIKYHIDNTDVIL